MQSRGALRRVMWTVSLCVSLGVLGAARLEAACTKVEPGWLWNYDGAIAEKYRIRMTLVFGTDEIKGVYFHGSQLRDLRLKGRIEQGSRLLLDELDAAGKVTGRIDARFVTRDPKGRYGDSELACEVIVGTWSKPDGTGAMTIYLSMEGGTAGSLTRRYGAIGVKDDEVVHRGAQRFWRAVSSDERATVAASLRYPIRVMLGARWCGSPDRTICSLGTMPSSLPPIARLSARHCRATCSCVIRVRCWAAARCGSARTVA